jgi:hypothetical protein
MLIGWYRLSEFEKPADGDSQRAAMAAYGCSKASGLDPGGGGGHPSLGWGSQAGQSIDVPGQRGALASVGAGSIATNR